MPHSGWAFRLHGSDGPKKTAEAADLAPSPPMGDAGFDPKPSAPQDDAGLCRVGLGAERRRRGARVAQDLRGMCAMGIKSLPGARALWRARACVQLSSLGGRPMGGPTALSGVGRMTVCWFVGAMGGPELRGGSRGGPLGDWAIGRVGWCLLSGALRAHGGRRNRRPAHASSLVSRRRRATTTSATRSSSGCRRCSGRLEPFPTTQPLRTATTVERFRGSWKTWPTHVFDRVRRLQGVRQIGL